MAAMYGGTYIKAWHSNMPYVKVTLSSCRLFLTVKIHSFILPPPDANPADYDEADLKVLERGKLRQEKGTGYFQQQSTQPQTLGYSLADSPVGLLAWIYEKLVASSDSYPWDDDEGLLGFFLFKT